jgi:hypothetical protein
MTKQQRKALLICLAIVVLSYVVRSIASFSSQMAFNQQQALRAFQQQQTLRAAQEARIKASLAQQAKTDVLPPNLPGIWVGRTTVGGRGICNLRFELKETGPGLFAGYSTLSSLNPNIAMYRTSDNPLNMFLDDANPDSAVLSGKLEKGSIRFHVDRTIGKDLNGCAVASMTLTPFGSMQLAAEWQDGGSCQGGHVLLRKDPNPSH